MLAEIRHEQARLPEERVQLYDRAVKTLMDTWNRGRSLAGIDVGGVHLPINNLVRDQELDEVGALLPSSPPRNRSPRAEREL